MLIKRSSDIPASEITPREVYLRRRELLRAAALAGVGAALGGASWVAVPVVRAGEPIANIRASQFSTDESPTARADITSYNNFYELGTDKSDPKRNADQLQTRPWQVVVEGECEAPGVIGIEDILSDFPQEERIYRLRCVEAWAMVVPWVGFPLADLLKRFKPTSK
ncbi:MAG: molybdopterin-dependent oxidoreductase, partial [Thiohalocapsa sp.]